MTHKELRMAAEDLRDCQQSMTRNCNELLEQLICFFDKPADTGSGRAAVISAVRLLRDTMYLSDLIGGLK